MKNMRAAALKAVFDSKDFENEFHCDAPLGAFVTPQGTRFALWAPTAERVTLYLHHSGHEGWAYAAHALVRGERGLWTWETGENLDGVYYGYDVTVDGVTRPLSEPFLVVATQNPLETQGTFPLPEAQLDRFLIKAEMGYPTADEGAAILRRFQSDNPLDSIEPVATAAQIVDAQKSFTRVFVSDDIMHYIIRIAEETRTHQDIILGVSPRGTQALLRASQVCAILRGRDFVTPDDIREMVPSVFGHRIILKSSARIKKNQNLAVLSAILSSVPVPTEDIRAKR